MVESPYDSIQNLLYAIPMVGLDFPEPTLLTNSQCAGTTALHIETAELIQDDPKLTSLFLQLQQIIGNRNRPLYITRIRSHMGLPGPLVQRNDEIDQLLVGNVLEASEFNNKKTPTTLNSKGLKRVLSLGNKQGNYKDTSYFGSLHNQIPLPAGSHPKGAPK